MGAVRSPKSSDGCAQLDVQVTETSLYVDVETMLQAVGPSLGDHDILVLPPYQRDGRSLYGHADVDAVRLARKVGLNAAFLYGAEERRYLHEYSAGWLVAFAVALGANVSSVGLAALANYFMARARKAVDEGLHSGPVENVPIQVRVARFHRGADGEVTLKGLRIEGPAAPATETLRTLLRPDLQTGKETRSLQAGQLDDGLESSSRREKGNERKSR